VGPLHKVFYVTALSCKMLTLIAILDISSAAENVTDLFANICNNFSSEYYNFRQTCRIWRLLFALWVLYQVTSAGSCLKLRLMHAALQQQVTHWARLSNAQSLCTLDMIRIYLWPDFYSNVTGPRFKHKPMLSLYDSLILYSFVLIGYKDFALAMCSLALYYFNVMT